METFLFYFFSGVTLLSALCVITLSKLTRVLLSLIITMFALAVLYLMLGAAFVAMVHLIVYAGAILVLFLFVIMLQGIGAKDTPLGQRFHPAYLFLATFVGILFAGAITLLFVKSSLSSGQGVSGGVESLAEVLFRDYLLPFELVSLLLILGVLAAVSLAKKEESA